MRRKQTRAANICLYSQPQSAAAAHQRTDATVKRQQTSSQTFSNNIHARMVRARRVRAVVACAPNDECCSPNPKRKDPGAIKGKLSHITVNKTITQFFHVVKNDHLPDAMLEDTNDLDDVDKEAFTDLPDVVIDDDGDDYKEDKPPSTPHRIQLRDDCKDIKELHKLTEWKHLPLICDDVVTTEGFKAADIILEAAELLETREKAEIKENDDDLLMKTDDTLAKPIENESTTTTAAKARRRLNNNQSSNQQPVAKVKHDAEPKQQQQQQHTLTEYFPVRRSVRKTKKIVLEEKQRSLEDILKRGVEDGLEVHNFEGKGRGIVAVRIFNRGDFVVEYAGDLIDMQEARVREIKYAQDQNTGCYMYYFKHKNTQYCIDATAETGRLGRLVNHSRNGNLVTRMIDINGKPRLMLVAKDSIQIGDEVTYDYGDRSKESLKHHPWLAY